MIDAQSTGPLGEGNGASKTGPAIVGIMLNWWLFGILVMQYFIYCSYSASKDKKALRIVVHLLFALDTIQTIMTMVDAFDWFVYGFGNIDAMLDFNTASIDAPFLDGLIAFIVQMVYCWRIKVLSKSRILPALIAFFAFVGGVNGIFVGIFDRIVKRVTNVKPNFNAPVLLWLWSSVVADVLIACSMIYLVLKLRSYRLRSKAVVAMKRVLILTLETNFLTTAVATATAIMFVAKPLAPPRTNIHLVGGYIIGKLYSNCFMVLLNQRIHREKQDLEHGTAQDLNIINTSSTANSSTSTIPKSESKSAFPKVGSPSFSEPSFGEISAMQFAEPPSMVDLKVKSKAGEMSMSESDLT